MGTGFMTIILTKEKVGQFNDDETDRSNVSGIVHYYRLNNVHK